MIFAIPAGAHKSRPRQFKFWFRRREWRWHVTFSATCRYTPDPEDDTHKLIGIGFLWSHHKNSARYGWRYDPLVDQIKLYAYTYDNGVRGILYLRSVEFGEMVTLTLTHQFDRYLFGDVSVMKTHRKLWTFGLWPYFGGNARAPHQMEISII